MVPGTERPPYQRHAACSPHYAIKPAGSSVRCIRCVAVCRFTHMLRLDPLPLYALPSDAPDPPLRIDPLGRYTLRVAMAGGTAAARSAGPSTASCPRIQTVAAPAGRNCHGSRASS